MSLEPASLRNQQRSLLTLNERSANITQGTEVLSPSQTYYIPRLTTTNASTNKNRSSESTTSPNAPSESSRPINFLTDGGVEGAGGASTNFTSASSFSSSSSLLSSSGGETAGACGKSSSSIDSTCSTSSASGNNGTNVKSLLPYTAIKFSDSPSPPAYDSNGAITSSSEEIVSCMRVENVVGCGVTSSAMSAHQNNTNSSSTINTQTSTKPPPSPKFGNKSKSRHSSASDSACVTPTGGSGGTGTPAGTPGGDAPDKHSIRVTRKIFNNWRSACGRTKKDFMRRWKTLPENKSECEPGEDSEQAQSGYGSMEQSGGGSSSVGPATISTHSTSNIASSVSGTNTSGGGVGSGDYTQPMSGKSSSGFGKIRSLTKKFSQDIPSEDISSSSISQSKPSTGWSVHVWATYVQRGLDDEDALSTKEEAKPGRDLLTDFQKTKLTHFFRHVLDMNHDDVISAADFVALNQRIRHYIEWSPECIEFHVLKEVHSGFLECFLNQPLDDCSIMYYCSKEKETRDHVNLDEWLDVWGGLLENVRTLEDLPLWLQYFPKIIFQVINKSGSQKITREELRAFYTMFLGIDFRVVNETLDSIYNAMTDGGKNPIHYRLFKLCFANFLFGKYPHGPGQYMFGVCSPESLHCNFPIDYSAMNTSPDDLQPYDPHKEKDHQEKGDPL